MLIVEFLFISSLVAIVYTYIGYPFLLYLISLIQTHPVHKRTIPASVTFIITAYNAETALQTKLDNTLRLAYQRDNLEIIVVSDGSIDKTNEIVKSNASKGVILINLPTRVGKDQAQRVALNVAKGEIIVFSDVGTTLEKYALLELVSNFGDPTVGCVSTEDAVITACPGKANREGLYILYEMFVRRIESLVSSLTGLSGSCFAVRKKLCWDWHCEGDSDFLFAIYAIRRGYRSVSDPSVVAAYATAASEKIEFDRRVRTALRGICSLREHLEALNPFEYGFFAFQLLSHKLLRWILPALMVTLLASNVALMANSPSNLANCLLYGQAIFYTLAFAGLLSKNLERYRAFKIPAFLLMVNLSIIVAWIKFFQGQRAIVWEPTKRS